MSTQLRLAPLVEKPGSVIDVRRMDCRPDDPRTPKGSRTWNFIMPVTLHAHRGRRMLACRIKGEEVGNHFHPRVENKDPEIFIVIRGGVKFHFTDLFGDIRTEEIWVEGTTNPVIITIPPYVMHQLEVLSDTLLFEEFQTGPFDPAANYSQDEFELLFGKLQLRR
jgi:cupin fold WbuC family metalloprotein